MPDDAPVMTTVLPSKRFAIADAMARLAVCETTNPREMRSSLGNGRFDSLEKAGRVL